MARNLMNNQVVSCKRVAIISDSIEPYNSGGKETRIFELSTRLAAAGYDVHIYTMHWWKDRAKHQIQNGVHVHALCKLYPLYNGERRSIKQGILFGLSCFKLLGERFDVVDVDHMPYFPLYSVRIVAWLKRKSMIATWHEVWGHAYWKTYLGRAGVIAYAVEKMSTYLPSTIISVSKITDSRLKTEMNVTQPTIVVQNGVDLAQIRQVRARRMTSDIMYAGRLIEHKNIDVLLHAVARLKRTNTNITCFIIGDGPERMKLESLAQELGLVQNVRFFGFLPNHLDVYAYMKASKVFVLPSTREGFGISVIEANACGLPVVTIDHPDNAAKALITTFNGRLVKLSDRAIARHVGELLARPRATATIRATASSYDWNTSVEKLAEVYGS